MRIPLQHRMAMAMSKAIHQRRRTAAKLVSVWSKASPSRDRCASHRRRRKTWNRNVVAIGLRGLSSSRSNHQHLSLQIAITTSSTIYPKALLAKQAGRRAHRGGLPTAGSKWNTTGVRRLPEPALSRHRAGRLAAVELLPTMRIRTAGAQMELFRAAARVSPTKDGLFSNRAGRGLFRPSRVATTVSICAPDSMDGADARGSSCACAKDSGADAANAQSRGILRQYCPHAAVRRVRGTSVSAIRRSRAARARGVDHGRPAVRGSA